MTLVYDGSTVYVTQDQLDNFTASEELITINHGLGLYPTATVAPFKWGAGVGGAGEFSAGGTSPHSVVVEWEWPSSNAITIFVPRWVRLLGDTPQLHIINSRAYVVTFDGNDEDCLYIGLIGGEAASQGDDVPVETVVQVVQQAVVTHDDSQCAHNNIHLDGGTF